MNEARWQWLVANVVDRETGAPIGGASPYVVRTFGTFKVGFIGLCLTTSEISRDKLTRSRLIDPFVAAAVERAPDRHFTRLALAEGEFCGLTTEGSLVCWSDEPWAHASYFGEDTHE